MAMVSVVWGGIRATKSPVVVTGLLGAVGGKGAYSEVYSADGRGIARRLVEPLTIEAIPPETRNEHCFWRQDEQRVQRVRFARIVLIVR